jgi:hypothetical protein
MATLQGGNGVEPESSPGSEAVAKASATFGDPVTSQSGTTDHPYWSLPMHRTVPALLLLAALPLSAQETRFTPSMSPGNRLELSNINGPVVITQGNGRTAEIVVTKRVIKGDGSYVKAIMEEADGMIRVCTIYTNRDPDRKSCKGDNSNTSRRGDNYDEVEMRYEVRVPAGVLVEAENVNGTITATGLDAEASLSTVNGGVIFTGNSARELQTVNGKVQGTFLRPSWTGTLEVSSVNGGVELTFPASFDGELRGTTVNGGVSSDFPVTIEGKWGPKSFTAQIGRGGRRLNVETVNGGISLKKG